MIVFGLDAGSTNDYWIPAPPTTPVMPRVRVLPKCRRCNKRTGGREGELCNVCRGKGRR